MNASSPADVIIAAHGSDTSWVTLRNSSQDTNLECSLISSEAASKLGSGAYWSPVRPKKKVVTKSGVTFECSHMISTSLSRPLLDFSVDEDFYVTDSLGCDVVICHNKVNERRSMIAPFEGRSKSKEEKKMDDQRRKDAEQRLKKKKEEDEAAKLAKFKPTTNGQSTSGQKPNRPRRHAS